MERIKAFLSENVSSAVCSLPARQYALVCICVLWMCHMQNLQFMLLFSPCLARCLLLSPFSIRFYSLHQNASLMSYVTINKSCHGIYVIDFRNGEVNNAQSIYRWIIIITCSIQLSSHMNLHWKSILQTKYCRNGISRERERKNCTVSEWVFWEWKI